MASASLLLGKEELARCEKIITGSIKKAVEDSKSKGVVLGLSGGIDSALVLSLACRAEVDVHAMILPEESVSFECDVSDSKALAESLGVGYSVVRINRVLEAIEKDFPWNDFSNERKRVSLGNAKARLRMVYNYLAANLDQRLVLGTGNKTEILLGYATKYGDGGVDMLPIGDLYKTQVRQLAAYIRVPEDIIKKVPTAGLWKGQTDEGEIGVSYDVMDEVLFQLVDMGLTVQEAVKKTDKDPSIVKMLYDRMQANSHKRSTPPITWLFDQR